MYSLESLKPLNAPYDSTHRLEEHDVKMVNRCVELIESTRKDKPCTGDIIEYTDEYGKYYKTAHIQAIDESTGQIMIYACAHVPFVFREDDGNGMSFSSGGGSQVFIDSASMPYLGKREKLFKEFGHCLLPGHGAVCFNATVNVWEYIAPNQKHPGYSTKDWRRQYISYRENPVEGCVYRYYGQDIAFKNAAELNQWKSTYKAVEFPGTSPNQTVLFFYRECDRLVSREEWDALDFPLDTRFVNGLIHVKVTYDDDAHMITVYRFTNSGYLDSKRFGPYERAKGTKLIAPGSEIKQKKAD